MASAGATWPLALKPIRDAVGHLLLAPSLAAVRCTAEQLITPLNSIGDATGREDVMLVTAEMIGKAFSNCGQEFPAYTMETSIFQREGKQITSGVLKKREGIIDFGMFGSEIDAEIQERMANTKLSNSDGHTPPPHPLDNWGKIRRKMEIPDEVKQELHTFLKKRMADKKHREKSAAKKKAKRMLSSKRNRSPVKSTKKGSDGKKKPSSPKAAKKVPPEVSPAPGSPTKPTDPKKEEADRRGAEGEGRDIH